MKRSSNELFHLISSLTGPEKGYFKKFCSIHSYGKENQYLILFDEINKCITNGKSYDESIIKKDLKFKKQLPYIKNYLHNLILRSLRLYHSGRGSELTLNEIFISVQLLYEKGSIKEVKKYLKKAVKIAESHELFNYHMQAADWLIKTESSAKEIDRLRVIKNLLLEKMDTINLYQNILNKLHAEINKHHKDHIAKQIVEIRSELKSNGNRYKDCFFSEVYYRMTLNLIYFYEANWADMNINCTACLSLVRQYPHILRANNKIYYNMMINRMISLYYMSEFALLNRAINEIETDTNTHGEYKYMLIIESKLILLASYAKTGNGHKIRTEISSLVNYIGESEKNLSKGFISTLCFHIAYYFLLIGSYDDALAYINRILNNETGEILLEIRIYARLLSIIIHFEIENIELVDYKVTSIKRFLKKRAKNNKFENIVIDFFRRIIKTRSKQETEDVIEKTRRDISALENVIGEIQVLNYFDYNSWLDSIKQKTTIGKVITDKLH